MIKFQRVSERLFGGGENENVYAAVEEGEIIGGGVTALITGAVVIKTYVSLKEESAEFILRSLIYVASLCGLDVIYAADDRDVERFGFKEIDGVKRVKAKDIVYPHECGR